MNSVIESLESLLRFLLALASFYQFHPYVRFTQSFRFATRSFLFDLSIVSSLLLTSHRYLAYHSGEQQRVSIVCMCQPCTVSRTHLLVFSSLPRIPLSSSHTNSRVPHTLLALLALILLSVTLRDSRSLTVVSALSPRPRSSTSSCPHNHLQCQTHRPLHHTFPM